MGSVVQRQFHSVDVFAIQSVCEVEGTHGLDSGLRGGQASYFPCWLKIGMMVWSAALSVHRLHAVLVSFVASVTCQQLTPHHHGPTHPRGSFRHKTQSL